jgi:hypothetical protein
MGSSNRSNDIRRFWGFRQNGRPVLHLGDYVRERRGGVAGYAIEFGELDPAEQPAPADCSGVFIRLLRANGDEAGPYPGIYDNRPGRGHVYLVADPGPALAENRAARGL